MQRPLCGGKCVDAADDNAVAVSLQNAVAVPARRLAGSMDRCWMTVFKAMPGRRPEAVGLLGLSSFAPAWLRLQHGSTGAMMDASLVTGVPARGQGRKAGRRASGVGEQGRASAQCGGAPPASGPSRSPAAGAPVPVRMPCQRGCHHISECMRQSQHLRRWGKAGRGPELGPEEGLGAGGALHAQQALPLQPQSSSRLVVVPGQAGRRTRVRVEAPVCCFSYFSWEGACSR